MLRWQRPLRNIDVTYNDTEIGLLLPARGVFPNSIETRSEARRSVEYAAFERLVEDGALMVEIEVEHSDEDIYKTAVITKCGRGLLDAEVHRTVYVNVIITILSNPKIQQAPTDVKRAKAGCGEHRPTS